MERINVTFQVVYLHLLKDVNNVNIHSKLMTKNSVLLKIVLKVMIKNVHNVLVDIYYKMVYVLLVINIVKNIILKVDNV